jgi:preprotein translocase SecE subunit
MANNEEISQEVKVEESRPVSVENETTEVKTAEETTVKVEKEANTKEVKVEKADKSKNKKKRARAQKPNKIAKSLKETGSELKKVTWPKFGTVAKQTGVVILVTLLFLAVVFGLDRLCSWIMGFIV